MLFVTSTIKQVPKLASIFDFAFVLSLNFKYIKNYCRALKVEKWNAIFEPNIFYSPSGNSQTMVSKLVHKLFYLFRLLLESETTSVFALLSLHSEVNTQEARSGFGLKTQKVCSHRGSFAESEKFAEIYRALRETKLRTYRYLKVRVETERSQVKRCKIVLADYNWSESRSAILKSCLWHGITENNVQTAWMLHTATCS